MTAQRKIVPPAVVVARPISHSPGGETTAADHREDDTLRTIVSGKIKVTKPRAKPSDGTSPVPDHSIVESHRSRVGGELEASHATGDTHVSIAGDDRATPAIEGTQPAPAARGWLELRIWSEMFHDAQKLRIAQDNRAKRGGVDGDLFAAHVAMFEGAEDALGLAMRRCYRRVVPPEIRAWQRAERGIGEHLLARLLGHLGDPYIATPHRWVDGDLPENHVCDPARCGERHLVSYEPYVRSISQLWSYCGVGDAARKRRVGMTQDDALRLGSPICKMLVHLLAEACMKQPAGSRYRDVYVAGRERYRDREGWTLGHQHNAALRLVKKELLRDLWIARDRAAGQCRCETHITRARGTTPRTVDHRSSAIPSPPVDGTQSKESVE